LDFILIFLFFSCCRL